MLLKSASGVGLSTRATGVRVESAVREDTPVRVVDTELAPVGVALGVLELPVPLGLPRTGSR
jgi:hypothetical protein